MECNFSGNDDSNNNKLILHEKMVYHGMINLSIFKLLSKRTWIHKRI